MVGLPFFESSDAAGTPVPALEIEIAGAEQPDGFGGLADAATSLLGGAAVSPWTEHLVALSIRLAMAPRVDAAEMVVAHTARAPTAAVGDAVTVRMGDAGSLADVFKGAVVGIERRDDGLRRYRLANASHTLARTRFNQTLTEVSVADAVRFAAGEAGVNASVRAGGGDSTLPQYVFDDARSAWDHVAELARLRGFSAWVDASDTLQVADGLEQGDVVQRFAYARDVLAARTWSRSPHAGAVTVLGAAVADDGFTLRKQSAPNRAAGGDGPPQRFHRHGSLRAPEDLSQRVAGATTLAHRRTTAGALVLPGSASLAPGAVIEVADLPDSPGKFLVLGVRHAFDHVEGWRTHAEVSEAGDVPGLSDLLGTALGALP